MNWKRLIAVLISVIYAVIVVIVLPILIYERNRHYSSKVEAWFIGGLFVLATLPLSGYGIFQHACNYTKPHLQKYIIRILFMVPIYALNSWIVLKFPETSIYLDTIREMYEAFVIYNFTMYLIAFLKYEVPDMEQVALAKRDIKWACCLPPCSNGVSVLEKCKFGVLQNTLVRIITSLIAYISEIFKTYNEGQIDFKFSWSYLAIANNFSQMIAMFCLILFYTVFREELKPLKPIRQYLCIKFVVFATFWQSVLLAILVKFDLISINHWPYFPTVVDTVNGLQDFLICIEMFIASIAHILAFPATPYKPENVFTSSSDASTGGSSSSTERHHWVSNIANAANVSDFNSDVKEHFTHIGSKVKRAFIAKNRRNNNGTTQSGAGTTASSATSSVAQIANESEDVNENSNLLVNEDNNIGGVGPLLSIQTDENNQNEISIEI